MQTIHLEHDQITGSKYILKDFDRPCTTIKYASHKSKTKPSNKVSINFVHKKRPVKKSHKIEVTPILYIDVLHIEYALESQEMFSNKKSKNFEKRITMKRKKDRKTKQFLQTFAGPENKPAIMVEVTPHVCEIVTDFIKRKVEMPYLVLTPAIKPAR